MTSDHVFKSRIIDLLYLTYGTFVLVTVSIRLTNEMNFRDILRNLKTKDTKLKLVISSDKDQLRDFTASKKKRLIGTVVYFSCFFFLFFRCGIFSR